MARNPTITTISTRAWRLSLTRIPNATTSDSGISRIAKISSRSLKPVGFSNGWAELALYGPPPLVPSSLIASCEANGPPGMCCSVISVVWSIVVADRVAAQVLNRALRDQDHRHHHRERDQDPHDRPCQVDPEVAEVARAGAGDAADQTDHHRHAGRRRHEVLDGEPDHLREVAHRLLAREPLPVGVGDEADGGVERTHRRRRSSGRSG